MEIAGDFLLLKSVGEIQQHSASQTASVVWEPLISLGALLVFHCGYYGMIYLTLRRLMSYIYGAPILDVSRSHTTTQHSR